MVVVVKGVSRSQYLTDSRENKWFEQNLKNEKFKLRQEEFFLSLFSAQEAYFSIQIHDCGAKYWWCWLGPGYRGNGASCRDTPGIIGILLVVELSC